ncbi:hypothetical protein MMC13_006751 [Lambiella insularis]|nr:hypothetical protein [Lambiella insularis]
MPSKATGTRPKRTRASLPKVRTGCMTCKIRHVKCDEQKPSCVKCIRTGRVCDGYSRFFTAHSDWEQKRQVIPYVKITPLQNLDVRLPGSDKERRSFDFFRVQTLAELEISLHTPTWNRLILQLSHNNPIVRHAAVALGAIGERFFIHDVSTPHNQEANACHDYGLLHYQKALGSLREHICRKGEDTISLILISCFLFICFEFMQGNEAGVLAHLQSGLNIVRGLEAKTYEAASSLICSRSSSSLDIDIKRVYTILDVQATLWLGSNEVEGTRITEPPENLRALPPIKAFADLHEAQIYLGSYSGRMLYFSRSLSHSKNIREDDILKREEGDEIVRLLEEWPNLLQELFIRKSHELSVEHLQWVAVMSTNHKVIRLSHSCTMESDKAAVYHRLEHLFEDIIRLSNTLLEPVNAMRDVRLTRYLRIGDPLEGPMPVFHFTVGLIQPLYFTAIKCRNRSISQRAIAMLATAPWREDAWDSAAMAKIAERKVKVLEVEGWYDTTGSYNHIQSPIDLGEIDVGEAGQPQSHGGCHGSSLADESGSISAFREQENLQVGCAGPP